MNPSTIEIIGSILFALAIVHTFSTSFFEHQAHKRPAHAGVWHLLGEVEVVFGFWAFILILFMWALSGGDTVTHYMDGLVFTEAMFVFVIMVIAASRAVLQLVGDALDALTRWLPLPKEIGKFWATLVLLPILGSLITEPAAMTLAALVLHQHYFSRGISNRMKYAVLGVLFVNVSVGGTLTTFAAPPVLMVAKTWGWDLLFMWQHFGWKTLLAVTFNGSVLTLLFHRELLRLPRQQDAQAAASEPLQTQTPETKASKLRVPPSLVLLHVLFLAMVVAAAHHAAIFMGIFLFFLGFAHAYERFQDRLIIREGLLVAFFLAGLVVLGAQQQWWLKFVLLNISADSVFYAAAALTAVVDNAAITYLASLVDGLSADFRYAVVAGAVTGGGLTIIANAPNPAGIAILRGDFYEKSVGALGLFLAALPATLVVVVVYRWC